MPASTTLPDVRRSAGRRGSRGLFLSARPGPAPSIPAIGLGTFASDRFPLEAVGEAVKGAIEVGYRHIDCAAVYLNEAIIGEALAGCHACGTAAGGSLDHLQALERQARGEGRDSRLRAVAQGPGARLPGPYLVHWPFPNAHAPGVDVSSRDPHARPYVHEEFMATWRQMEALVSRGLVRHIGTSNMSIAKLKLLLRDAAVKPACNEMELHPHFQQPELFKFVTGQRHRAHRIQPNRITDQAGSGQDPSRHCRHRRPGRPCASPAAERASRRSSVSSGPCNGDRFLSRSRFTERVSRQSEGRRLRAPDRGRDGRAGHHRQELPADQRAGFLWPEARARGRICGISTARSRGLTRHCASLTVQLAWIRPEAPGHSCDWRP